MIMQPRLACSRTCRRLRGGGEALYPLPLRPCRCAYCRILIALAPQISPRPLHTATLPLSPQQPPPMQSRLCSLKRIALVGATERPCRAAGVRAVVPHRRLSVAAAGPGQAQQQQPSGQQQRQQQQQQQPGAAPAPAAALWALAALPAAAADIELSGGPPASSYYVSLGLFLMTVPGGRHRRCALLLLASTWRVALPPRSPPCTPRPLPAPTCRPVEPHQAEPQGQDQAQDVRGGRPRHGERCGMRLQCVSVRRCVGRHCCMPTRGGGGSGLCALHMAASLPLPPPTPRPWALPPAFRSRAPCRWTSGLASSLRTWPSELADCVPVGGLGCQPAAVAWRRRRCCGGRMHHPPNPHLPLCIPLTSPLPAPPPSCDRYNYEVKERGEVVTFVGTYKASPSEFVPWRAGWLGGGGLWAEATRPAAAGSTGGARRACLPASLPPSRLCPCPPMQARPSRWCSTPWWAWPPPPWCCPSLCRRCIWHAHPQREPAGQACCRAGTQHARRAAPWHPTHPPTSPHPPIHPPTHLPTGGVLVVCAMRCVACRGRLLLGQRGAHRGVPGQDGHLGRRGHHRHCGGGCVGLIGRVGAWA